MSGLETGVGPGFGVWFTVRGGYSVSVSAGVSASVTVRASG